MTLKQKIILLVITLILSTTHVLASSSTTFHINDESLDFGYNAGFLQSSSYAMDLAGIPWVERYAESASYTIIDGNSMLDLEYPVVPPTPPPPDGDAGGRRDIPDYDYDIPIIGQVDIFQERPLNELPEEEVLHRAPPEKEVLHRAPPEEEGLTFIFTEEDALLHYKTQDQFHDYDDYDFIVDENYEVASLEVEILTEDEFNSEYGVVVIDGDTGANYEIVAIWIGEDYNSKSFAYADKYGDFMIKSPGILNDGEYSVLLYGLEKQENKIIQTKYSTLKFYIINGKVYLNNIESSVKINCFRWDFIILYIIIILLTSYSIWRKVKK